MRLRNTDITKLLWALYAELETGADVVLYKSDAQFLTVDEIFTINRNNLGLDRDVADIEPLANALLTVGQNMSVFDGKEGSWSIPFDIPLIEQNYYLGNKVKDMIMELENVKAENLSALEKTFLYTGMEGISRDELVRNMAEGNEKFTLALKEVYGDGSAEVRVNCGLSQKGNYFADSYDITVKQADQPDYTRNYKFKGPVKIMGKAENGSNKETFINSTITLKEAYNQMCGRAVNKNFVYVNKEDPAKNRVYNAWEYIDFTKVDNNGQHPIEKIYNYPVEKLEKELRAHPLYENKTEEDFSRLVSSLRRGNVQSVSYIEKDDSTTKLNFQANPQNQTINKYDQNMQPLILSLKREQDQTESQKQGNSKKANQKEDTQDGEPEQKQTRKRGMRAS